MSDSSFENWLSGEFFIQMQWVIIAWDTGKDDDIRFGDGLGVGRWHADSQVFDKVTMKVGF